MKKTGAVLVGSALSLVAGHAAASGFSVSYQSVSALGTAYAGAGVLSENASNQWYNPATLAGLKKAELSAAVHQVWVDTSFEGDASTTPFGNAPGDFDDVEPFIGSAFLAVPLTDMMTFGLGVNSPFGTKVEYDDNWGNQIAPPLFPVPAGTGDFYSTESDLKTYNVNPSLGIQLTDNLNVGVGVSYQRLDADIRNAGTRLEGDDDGYGWNLGLTYSPDDNNHFGVAYRSKIEYDVEGDITFNPIVAGPLAGTYEGETSVDLPASLQLSYAGDLSDRTQILMGVEWMEWSSLDKLEIDHAGPAPLPNPAVETFDWENTVRYSLGVRHAMNDTTVLRAGVAQEESTQGTDNRSAISPDSDRVWVTLGAGFTPVENMTIDVGYAHIFVEDADINRMDKGVPLKGTYELDADVIGAQLSYRF
ncbi:MULTISPECIES: OmpP1/FadL family transporter [Alcanivorax]|jgi:long-chain fatty acid transport protein|uniref:OmpP1/FadL family transporter n=1 Tax=Alcanivorax TaxID=59753 RepID=UPI002409772E|nr:MULTISPECIES: outer membrane protein transport protein [Alcanivorax]MDF1636664.1 outer membrane protein transport protein [Alcanivorax jadensis]MDF1724598.1 outer membrane protein transport protein [Alcanivorax sp.]